MESPRRAEGCRLPRRAPDARTVRARANNALERTPRKGVTLSRALAPGRKHEMPEISRFFGIIIRMYFDDHNPPHVHAEHQGSKALFDFHGNVLRGELRSRTARRLVREWIDLHAGELGEDWELARAGRDLKKIDPLD